MNTTRIATLTLAAVLGLALTGCTVTGSATNDASASTSTSTPSSSADAVTIEDPWIKAADDGAMTAVFGILHNDTDTARTVVSASTDVSPEVQLHQTSADASGKMVMSEVDGGFPLAAHGSHTLEPGGDHIMLMGLDRDLVAGDEVAVTVTFDDHSTLDFTAQVKDYTGAQEDYAGDHGESPSHTDANDSDHEGH